MLGNWLKRRRRRRILERQPIPDAEWSDVRRLPWLRRMDEAKLADLRRMVTWFLAEKRFYGAAELDVNRDMAMLVAVLSCLPVLHIGYDHLEGWTTVILYPGEFRVRHQHEDEYGLVSEEEGELSGEAWDIGPLVLSWTDVAAAVENPTDGENVVFHEIAHKLDMLNGEANGHPPLHPGMDGRAWARDMKAAFDAMNDTLDAGQETEIDPYAATDPAEFFAVTSEYYFEAPEDLKRLMPRIHAHLEAFFRPEG